MPSKEVVKAFLSGYAVKITIKGRCTVCEIKDPGLRTPRGNYSDIMILACSDRAFLIKSLKNPSGTYSPLENICVLSPEQLKILS